MGLDVQVSRILQQWRAGNFVGRDFESSRSGLWTEDISFENLLRKLERDYYEGMKGMTLSTVDWFQVLEIMDAKLVLEQGAVALSTTQVYSLNPSQPTWNKYLEHKNSVFWLVRFL